METCDGVSATTGSPCDSAQILWGHADHAEYSQGAQRNHKARHHRRGEGIKSPTDSSIGPAKIKGVWTSRRGGRHTRQTVCGWGRVEIAVFCCSTQGSSDEALCFLLETSSSLQFGAGDQIICHLGSCWHLLEQLWCSQGERVYIQGESFPQSTSPAAHQVGPVLLGEVPGETVLSRETDRLGICLFVHFCFHRG